MRSTFFICLSITVHIVCILALIFSPRRIFSHEDPGDKVEISVRAAVPTADVPTADVPAPTAPAPPGTSPAKGPEVPLAVPKPPPVHKVPPAT